MRKRKKGFVVLGMAAAMLASSTFSVSAAGLRDVFSAEYYAENYEDLKIAFGEDEEALYQHFIVSGLKENRQMSPILDVQTYRETYQDLDAAFGDDWDAYVEHFFEQGARENRTAGVLFDPVKYAEAYPDVAAAFGDDLRAVTRHFLDYGMKEGKTAGVVTKEAPANSVDINSDELAAEYNNKLVIQTGNALYPEYDVTKAESYGWTNVDWEEPLDISLKDIQWSLQTLDGDTINQDTFADKIVVLVFYKAVLGETACSRSARMISELAEATWAKRADVQIVAVDANNSDSSMVSAYRAEYAPECDNIIFAINGNSLLWRLVSRQNSENRITYTYCAIIQNKTLRYGLNMVDIATACKLRVMKLLGEGRFLLQGSAISGRWNGLSWQLDPIGVLTIGGSGEIPGYFDKKTLGNPPWEKYKNEILCVIIGEGVTKIRSESMEAFEYLGAVIVKDGVKEIEAHAFDYCDRITTIVIPSSISCLGYSFFRGGDAHALDVYYDGSKEQFGQIEGNDWLLNKDLHFNN